MFALKNTSIRIVAILFACIILGFCRLSIAQNSTDSTVQIKPKLDHGRWGLEFQLGWGFSNRGITSGILSGKYYFSRDLMARLEFAGRFVKSDGRDNVNNPFDPRINMTDDFNYVKISLMHLYNKSPEKNVKIQIGFGPATTFYYDYSSYLRKSEVFDDWRRDISTDWSIGLDGLLGVEVFLKKWLSMTAEYGASFYYRYYYPQELETEAVSYDYSTSINKGNSMDFETDGVLFGFSTYLKFGFIDNPIFIKKEARFFEPL